MYKAMQLLHPSSLIFLEVNWKTGSEGNHETSFPEHNFLFTFAFPSLASLVHLFLPHIYLDHERYEAFKITYQVLSYCVFIAYSGNVT
jgi:hypothetical protein